jgi:membrane protease YdiL (CAAX protease family)
MYAMKRNAKTILLILPILLIPSTALVFTSASNWLGVEYGYVLGFLFYWIVWCFLVPYYFLKAEGIKSLFKEEKPLFQKSNWLAAALLVVILSITFIMYPPAGLLTAPVKLLVIAVPVAIINGICEELLWRGLYTKVFPDNIALGVVVPSIGFALWHISPQLVIPVGTGMWPFVASTFFLGISYGWISYRTSSIKWNAISHSIGGILDLGGAIAPSIFALWFQ